MQSPSSPSYCTVDVIKSCLPRQYTDQAEMKKQNFSVGVKKKTVPISSTFRQHYRQTDDSTNNYESSQHYRLSYLVTTKFSTVYSDFLRREELSLFLEFSWNEQFQFHLPMVNITRSGKFLHNCAVFWHTFYGTGLGCKKVFPTTSSTPTNKATIHEPTDFFFLFF